MMLVKEIMFRAVREVSRYIETSTSRDNTNFLILILLLFYVYVYVYNVVISLI